MKPPPRIKKRSEWKKAAIVLVWIVASFAMAIYTLFPVRHLEIIRAAAGDLEPALILAVIMAESSFREGASSHKNAQGLMQLMPATAQDVARRMGKTDFKPEDILVPSINIEMGCFYLNRLYQTFDCEELALAAYNAGQGNVRRWLADPETSRDGETLDSIPFSETHNYVNKVKLFRGIYRVLLMFY
ncbi:MAG: lytic transglycosylase domain-containing protein [Defluviitaleaceae bacterium]|nr:lytic transglycosylase domain-containing protein [Defluviitaleaceae bacterium]